jgi:tRNA threonylcarbamoyl adenosine modification protein (Sua5/YciO/YrdC/YwlC family)
MILKIDIAHPSARILSRAAETLRAGGIIIYPTDTVYGLGCSVERKDAIERIYLIKGQRKDKPFSFICSDLKNISEYAHVSNAAFRIMRRLIPGPYTFILPAAKMKHLPKILVSKRKTVGIRVPDSPIALALVKDAGAPVLSTSVTAEDGSIVSDPDDIIALYGNRVDIIIDGGPLVSDPSTVIDLTSDAPDVLRAGAGDASNLV